MSIRITNIQRFSLHDGPGIRTTVFMKGCNLIYPWCGNPECVYGKYSKTISSDELKKEILKDMPYYELNNGGVTFSGGEPLLQIDKLEDLLESLDINICFETALMVSESKVKKAIKYADEFIVDIKILDENECFNVLGGDVELFYRNVELVLNSNIPTTFRIPLAIDYTLTDKNVGLILTFLEKYKIDKLEIFKIHNLADEKYKKLNREYYYKGIDDETVNNFYKLVKGKVSNVEVLKY